MRTLTPASCLEIRREAIPNAVDEGGGESKRGFSGTGLWVLSSCAAFPSKKSLKVFVSCSARSCVLVLIMAIGRSVSVPVISCMVWRSLSVIFTLRRTRCSAATEADIVIAVDGRTRRIICLFCSCFSVCPSNLVAADVPIVGTLSGIAGGVDVCIWVHLGAGYLALSFGGADARSAQDI